MQEVIIVDDSGGDGKLYMLEKCFYKLLLLNSPPFFAQFEEGI